VRLPEAIHRAVLLATELGMDESFTAATSRALRERMGDFVRRQALGDHFTKFPADLPRLADVAKRRVNGSDAIACAAPQGDTSALGVRPLHCLSHSYVHCTTRLPQVTASHHGSRVSAQGRRAERVLSRTSSALTVCW